MSDLQSFVLICDFSSNKCTFAGAVNSVVVLLRFDETLWIGNNVDKSLRCSRRQQEPEPRLPLYPLSIYLLCCLTPDDSFFPGSSSQLLWWL